MRAIYPSNIEREMNMDQREWELLQQMLAEKQAPAQMRSAFGPSAKQAGPEMRAYEPSLWDIVRQALDSVGSHAGYSNLGQRTAETADLLSIPLTFAPLGAPARAAAAGAGPAWDGAMARVLQRKYPEEKAVTGGNPLGNNWFGVGGESYWDSSRGLSRLHELPRASRTNAMGWDPAAPPVNDKSALSSDGFRYLNELLAQRSRAGFSPVR